MKTLQGLIANDLERKIYRYLLLILIVRGLCFGTFISGIKPVKLVTSTGIGMLSYGATMIGLDQAWYAKYARTDFHWYNDFGEWEHMDKYGHFFTAYFQSQIVFDVYQYNGMGNTMSSFMALGMSNLFQGGIEYLDGHSQKWGASKPDLWSNFAGTSFFFLQQVMLNTQVVQPQWSAEIQDYAMYDDALIEERANDLFGAHWSNRILKDYNGQTYWLSHIFERIPLLRIFEISLGIGADGILGGYENEWKKDGENYRYDQIPRTQQHYFSIGCNTKHMLFLPRGIRRSLSTLKVPSYTWLKTENGWKLEEIGGKK